MRGQMRILTARHWNCACFSAELGFRSWIPVYIRDPSPLSGRTRLPLRLEVRRRIAFAPHWVVISSMQNFTAVTAMETSCVPHARHCSVCQGKCKDWTCKQMSRRQGGFGAKNKPIQRLARLRRRPESVKFSQDKRAVFHAGGLPPCRGAQQEGFSFPFIENVKPTGSANEFLTRIANHAVKRECWMKRTGGLAENSWRLCLSRGGSVLRRARQNRLILSCAS